MKDITTESLIKREKSIIVSAAQLVKEVRLAKDISQDELCERVDMSRQHLSKIENGHIKKLDLNCLDLLINGCGEKLELQSSYINKLQLSHQTEKEDQVLITYSQGRIEVAEELLAEIRRWQYPPEHLRARCKRNMAIAISYYFKGRHSYSQNKMNEIVMGLSLIGCGEEAERFIEMYYRIVKKGEQNMTEKTLVKKGVLS
ncbi:helix-turn-helix transcriptional regulator [uncultured Vagococcus sp.]|uniref:helix-turn-helix domain-containing protein n=1 Tax=uncultured Vagococcus sp. TaxID=189676 RepID=UPI0028D1C0F0|nr:helix-turn-helix transcriptional regulator [uncultured Vagococcus sp.]